MTIITQMSLPELTEVDEGEPAWDFELISKRAPVGELINEAKNGQGQVWLQIERDDGRYVLRFPEVAEFVVTPAIRHVGCWAEAATGISTVRHLLLDQVVPHVLALDESVVLHASAIVTPDGAVAFVAPSGFGKSSLAASFVSAGFPLLTDDFVLLVERQGDFDAIPSYPGLRLWPDSVAALGHGATLAQVRDGSEKQRLVLGDRAATKGAVPLLAVVVLGDPDADLQADIAVDRLSPRSGFVPLFEQAFRMERIGRQRQVAEFDRFARLTSTVRLLHLDYRRDYELLPTVRTEILDSLARF